VVIPGQAEKVWVPEAGLEVQVALAVRAAAPMAAILVQTDLRLPAVVRRPVVRAASATPAVRPGQYCSSDLSRWRLACAGEGVVVAPLCAQKLAYVDIADFRARNSGSVKCMEEFHVREERLADRCSNRKRSLGSSQDGNCQTE